jgi:hypothetical protein
VKDAKDLLYMHCDTTDMSRKIQRKGGEKTVQNMKDIMDVLYQMDPDNIPVFVARDLSKLPPVTYDHIDVSVLLTEMREMRRDIAELKREKQKVRLTTRELSESDSDDENLFNYTDEHQTRQKDVYRRPATPDNRAGDTGHKNRGGPRAASSGLNIDANEWPVGTTVTDTDAAVQVDCRQTGPVMAAEKTDTDSTASFAGIAAMLQSARRETGEEPFQTIGPRRRTPPVIGNSIAGVLRSAPVTKPPGVLFVTRLSADATPEQVTQHVSRIAKLKVTCERLQTKFPTYSSFKVTVDAVHMDELMQSQMWPENVLVRKFFPPRGNNPTRY